MVNGNLHVGRETSGLGVPVVHHAERAHHKMRAGSGGQMCQGGGGLAETHVVGEAAAQTDARQKAHPAQPASLVVAQFAHERVGFV
ncbi:unannotated protein [freshwater metagenome]|uniref:Unannotated protein n=1 Tax=freshwater metagenome TaxID=449393 RepID=A0A6J6Q0M1_9ZZZZ